jgi:hypothetical protein
MLGLGFGIPGVIGAEYVDRTGGIWPVLGFPSYGPELLADWASRPRSR